MAEPIIPITKPATTAPVKAVEAPKSSQPTETVALPSKGRFYPASSPLARGTLEIYTVTARHEDILSNASLLKKGTVLDEFLKAIIATPNVSINDLLIGDKNALFIAARISAYGNMYSTKIKCPECGVESVVDIDLSKLGVKEIDWSGIAITSDNHLNFTLPGTGKVITFSLLTHKDDTDIDQELKALAKFNAGATSPEVTTRLKYTIKAVDGNTDRTKIKELVDEQLKAIDSLALRKYIRDHTPDVDMNFEFTCPACGHQAKLTVPLGANFFWPNITES